MFDPSLSNQGQAHQVHTAIARSCCSLWPMAGSIRLMGLLHVMVTMCCLPLLLCRVFRSDKESPVTWIQFTFRIRSQQRFAAYSLSSQPGSPGKQATLVYGNPDELLDVEDYWVFEYKAKEPQNKTQQTWPGARWRLVGRLNV